MSENLAEIRLLNLQTVGDKSGDIRTYDHYFYFYIYNSVLNFQDYKFSKTCSLKGYQSFDTSFLWPEY